MAKFSYKGMDASRKSVSGTIEAADRKTAIMMLRGRGITISSLEENSGATKKAGFQFFTKSKNKIALSFLQKFLQLHAGGLAVGDAVRIMCKRLKDPQEKKLSESILKDISEGKTIANAMRSFPDIFSGNTICTVEAGERTGNLVPVIRNLIEFLETQQGLKKKFISSMAYPATVCVIGFAVGIIFMVFVLPRLQNMLTSLGGDLPAITQYLLSVSAFIMKYWYFFVAAIALGVVGFVAYRSTKDGRYNIDKWMTRIPIVGLVVKENFYCQTANLLATLLGSGINTTEAMTLAENAAGNLYFRKNFQEAKKMVLDGATVTQAFEQKGIMPDLALDLLSVGENTGDLASSFREIFKIYHTTLLEHMNMMTTAVTGIAMGAAFAGVAVLALSVVMSVLKLTTSIKL